MITKTMKEEKQVKKLKVYLDQYTNNMLNLTMSYRITEDDLFHLDKDKMLNDITNEVRDFLNIDDFWKELYKKSLTYQIEQTNQKLKNLKEKRSNL